MARCTFDVGRRFYGGNAIVGGGIPMAVGLALADRMQGRHPVTACFFGEGAAGEFHESANLAALWQLPVLFCCENNLYAMGIASPIRIRHQHGAQGGRVRDASSASGRHGCPGRCRGERSRRRCRTRRHGTALLELMTYRFRAHSMRDPSATGGAEVTEWRQRDLIDRLPGRLQREGMLDDAQLQSWSARSGDR